MSSRQLLVVVVVVGLCLLLTWREGQAAFNCVRPGSACVRGSCDYNSKCSCQKGYTGYQCDLEISRVAPKCPSNIQCKSGRCIKNSRGRVIGCHCDYEYYGAACDKPRYTMECYYDRMLMGLNPVNFKGHIRYIDKLTSSACDLKPISQSKAAGSRDFNEVDWQGYGIKAVHKKDPCNGDAAYSTTHGFDIYTRKLVVQYYDRVYVSLDEIVTFICAVEKNNPVNVMKSVFTAPLEEGFLDKSSVRGVGTHFVFSLHKSDSDEEIGDGDTLGVGALVFLKVKIREHSPFATLIIESCTADDGSGDNETTYHFHEQGCPVAPIGQWIMKPNAQEFQLYFKIFRFEETNQLRITCVVRGCTSWDSPSCSISQCSHVDRRKREAWLAARDATMARAMRKRRHLLAVVTGADDGEPQRLPRAAEEGPSTKSKNNKVILPDGGQPKVSKLNSSEVIRLTVVIGDKKKKNQQSSVVVKEVAIPDFRACTLSFEFWIVIIGLTAVLVTLLSTTITCALKRRKLKNKRKRKNQKAVKMALSNMRRMQMNFPWYN